MRIGEVAATLGISADALRYYETIGLLPRVGRSGGGLRIYGKKDLSRLRFIRRAKKMGFSLEEVASLLSFREKPQRAKPRVRELAHRKLAEIERHLAELAALRDELRLLTRLCGAEPSGCPILDEMDRNTSTDLMGAGPAAGRPRRAR